MVKSVNLRSYFSKAFQFWVEKIPTNAKVSLVFSTIVSGICIYKHRKYLKIENREIKKETEREELFKNSKGLRGLIGKINLIYKNSSYISICKTDGTVHSLWKTSVTKNPIDLENEKIISLLKEKRILTLNAPFKFISS